MGRGVGLLATVVQPRKAPESPARLSALENGVFRLPCSFIEYVTHIVRGEYQLVDICTTSMANGVGLHVSAGMSLDDSRNSIESSSLCTPNSG